MHQIAPKLSPQHDRALCLEFVLVFWICPEWLIPFFSALDGRLKEDRSQSKSWRGHGIAHEVHLNAPKCTKMITIAWQSKVFLICPEWLSSSIFGLDGHCTWKRIGVTASHGGVTGSHMRCTKMHQNVPKWSPWHDRAKNFEFILSD